MANKRQIVTFSFAIDEGDTTPEQALQQAHEFLTQNKPQGWTLANVRVSDQQYAGEMIQSLVGNG